MRGGEDEAGLGGDLLGDAVLEGEDIGGRAFKGLSPEVAVSARVDELGGDADAVAGADDGALDDGVDAELAGDIGERAAGTLVGHDGGSGDDAKIGDTGELSDQLVGHTVGEVLLARIAGEVLKRKNRNRADGGTTVSMEEVGSQRMGPQSEREDGNEHACAQRGGHPESAPGVNSRRVGGRGRDLRRSWRLDWNIRRRVRPGNVWHKLRNCRNETVARAGDCLDIKRQVRTVAQSLANFTDGRVDSVFDVDEDFLLPQALGDLFTGHDLAMFGDQKDEEFEGFPFELDPAAVAAELKFAAMKAEVAESIDGKGHRFPPGGG